MNIQDALKCVRQMVFLNCPNFNDSTTCKTTKEFFEKNDKCGLKLGGAFILSNEFWALHPWPPTIPIFQQRKKQTLEEAKCFAKLIKSSNCCKIPSGLSSIKEGCVRKCSISTRHDNCCVYDCNQSELQAFVDGKFYPDKFLLQFESDFSADADWKPVVEKSIETCRNLST